MPDPRALFARDDILPSMKVALVHDWLVTFSGAEKVLECLVNLYEDADVFTLIHAPEVLKSPAISSRVKSVSFLDRMPFARRKYQSYLPLMPIAIEQFDLSAYD